MASVKNETVYFSNFILDKSEIQKNFFFIDFSGIVFMRIIVDTAKRGLSQFSELFTVILCARKDFKR